MQSVIATGNPLGRYKQWVVLDSAFLNNPPSGFEVIERSADRVVLHYKESLRGWGVAVMIAFGIFWCTIGGVFVFMTLAASLWPMAVFGLVVLCLGIFGFASGVRSLLKTYIFTIDPEVLTISDGGQGLSATTSVARNDITRIFVRLQIVRSVSATPEGSMTSTSQVWSVVAYTPSAVKVLPSARRRQCEWFGNLLGEWAGCVVETDN